MMADFQGEGHDFPWSILSEALAKTIIQPIWMQM